MAYNYGQGPPSGYGSGSGYAGGAPPQHAYGGGPPQPGYGAPQPAGYPSQPGYASPPGYGCDPQIIAWFQAVDTDRSGQISAIELQSALTNANYSHFNPEACRLMIGMFDRDMSGTINLQEFQQLWTYINQWKGAFDRFDTNRSGAIDSTELMNAFGVIGYRVSNQLTHLICTRFDVQARRQLSLDNFIQACILMKMLTEAFRQRDTAGQGTIQVNYEDFMCMAMWNKP